MTTGHSPVAGTAASPSWPDGLDWWFVRLYPGGLDGLEPAVERLIPCLASFVEEEGAERWFFIRYTDFDGPHLRFRVRGRRRLLDRLHRELDRLAADCRDLGDGPHPPFTPLAPVDARAFAGRRSGADVALYEPEYDKYGGPTGVALAEELFQASSRLALRASALPRATDRAALAVLLMRASVHAVEDLHGQRPGAPTAVDFWERHLHWWTRDAGPQAAALRDGLRRMAANAESVAAALSKVADDPLVDRCRHDWTVAVSAYLDAATAVPRTPGHLIFHQNHMMLNRLGILPREEALLGLIAAQN